jgi:hypothetical protein
MTAKAVLGAAGSAPDGGANPGEMRTWLEGLDKLDLEAPYVVIGKALCRAGITRPELWGDAPDFLQQGQLREELVGPRQRGAPTRRSHKRRQQQHAHV